MLTKRKEQSYSTFTWHLRLQHLLLWQCQMFCELGKLWQVSPEVDLSFMRVQYFTLVHAHSCSATSLSKVGRSSEEWVTHLTRGRICNSASINNPSDRIHNEKSCWADGKIRKTSYDIHFSMVETWSGVSCYQILEYKLSLSEGWDREDNLAGCYQLLAINNFRRRISSTFGAKC
jgi:hypothetical protein